MESPRYTPTIVVPMAGLGSRFADAGYKDIKPLIDILGKPMIEHSVDSVGVEGNWVFVVQKEHREKYNLDAILDAIRPGCKIVDTGGGVTEGAACSILLAEPYIDPAAPLLIINSDNVIKWDADSIYSKFISSENDGLILCFTDTDPKWSFAKLDSAGEYVTEVAEKKPISNNATVGLYIWKRGQDFIQAAKQMISKNIRVNNEFYLCPVFNENIANGQQIIIDFVEQMHGVGTPEDLDKYLEFVERSKIV